MKIAFTADCHLTTQAKNPERFQALSNIFKQCKDNDIQLLVIAGDLFDKASGTDPNDFDVVSEAITTAGIEMTESEITLIPDIINEVSDVNKAHSIMRFVDALEDNEDVQNVYTNMDVDDAVMDEIQAEE